MESLSLFFSSQTTNLPLQRIPTRTGTVRGSLRGLFAGLEKEYPHLKENILSAMGNIDTGRLLDTRFLKLDGAGGEDQAAEPFPIVTEL